MHAFPQGDAVKPQIPYQAKRPAVSAGPTTGPTFKATPAGVIPFRLGAA